MADHPERPIWVWLKVAAVILGGCFTALVAHPDKPVNKEVNPYPDAILCRKDYPVPAREAA